VGLKGNAGAAHDFCKGLDWNNIPIVATTSDDKHGRKECRTLKRVALGRGQLVNVAKYAGAAYVFCVESFRDDGNEAKTEKRYFIGSKGLKKTPVDDVLKIIREHWIQENGSHWAKDAILGEDDLFPQSPRGSRLLGFMKDIVVAIGYSMFKSVQEFVDRFDASPEAMMRNLMRR
jgi:predicted transposase YbfD/YdcC